MHDSTTSVPEIECHQVLPSLFVSDVAGAVDYYVTRLGFRHQFNWGTPLAIAGVGLGNMLLHLHTSKTSVHVAGQVGFVISNLHALYEFHKRNGIEIIDDLKTLSYGIRTYTIIDAFGNYLNFRNYVRRTNPVTELVGKN